MHQIPFRVPMAYSRKLRHIQEFRPAIRNMASTELPRTSPEIFIQMLGEADLMVFVGNRETLKEVLRIGPTAPMLDAQRLVLEHLRQLGDPINAQNRKERNRKIFRTTNRFFLQLIKTKSFKYVTEMAIKQSPEVIRESYPYQIISGLVRAGLLSHSSVESCQPDYVESHIRYGPIGNSPLSLEEIENPQFGANA
ncbi:hypothetical protein BGX38DRAFT_737643 [Terfezia claveryi]|nr:hypothetical protein BGX38DRAFT_737643 [Terfezia claveryi]